MILCNNEDKAAGRNISLPPRLQAEMLGHLRLNPMPSRFCQKIQEIRFELWVHDDRNVTVIIGSRFLTIICGHT